MSRLRRIAISLFIGIAGGLHAQALSAQTLPREEPAAFGAAGFVRTSAVFGDDDPKRAHDSGVTLGVLVRGPRAGRSAWTFEATVVPDPLQNPHFAESFAPLCLQVGRQIGRRVYIRPGAGVTLQGGGPAPMVSIAIGSERQFRNGVIGAPELIIRAGGAVGIAGWMAGVQVPIGRHMH